VLGVQRTEPLVYQWRFELLAATGAALVIKFGPSFVMAI